MADESDTWRWFFAVMAIGVIGLPFRAFHYLTESDHRTKEALTMPEPRPHPYQPVDPKDPGPLNPSPPAPKPFRPGPKPK